MAVHEYLHALRRRWRMVVSGILLGAGAAVVVIFVTPPQYAATSEVLVSAEATTDQLAANQGSTFVQSRVKSYVAVVTSPDVLAGIRSQLSQDYPVIGRMSDEQLRGRLSASAQPDASLLAITATDGSASAAAAIANAATQSLTQVVRAFETPSGSSTSAVKLLATSPAMIPTSPANPDPPVDIAIGLLAGALIGIAAAALREGCDVTITTSEQLAVRATSPVLATIVNESPVHRRPVAARAAVNSPRAEGFRQLRTNLQFVDIDQPPRIIAVTSAVPGEGKTSTAVNVAAALADGGANVCVIDADLRRPSVADALGLVGSVGLTSVLLGKIDVLAAIQPVGRSLSALTTGPLPPNPSELLASNQARELIHGLAEHFDFVIVDTAPLLPVADGAEMAAIADGTLLVTQRGRTTFAQLQRSIEMLQRVDAILLGTVLNRVPSRQAMSDGYANYGRRTSANNANAAPQAETEAIGTTSTSRPPSRLRAVSSSRHASTRAIPIVAPGDRLSAVNHQ